MILRRQVWTLIVCLVLAVGLRLVWGESGWKVTGHGPRHAVEPTEQGIPILNRLCWEGTDGQLLCIDQPHAGVFKCHERLYDALQEVWALQHPAIVPLPAIGGRSFERLLICDDLCEAKRLVAELEAKYTREAKVQAVLKDCNPNGGR